MTNPQAQPLENFFDTIIENFRSSSYTAPKCPYPLAGSKIDSSDQSEQPLYDIVDSYYIVHYDPPGHANYPINRFAADMATRFFMAAETGINVNYSKDEIDVMLTKHKDFTDAITARVEQETAPSSNEEEKQKLFKKYSLQSGHRALTATLIGAIVNRTVDVTDEIVQLEKSSTPEKSEKITDLKSELFNYFELLNETRLSGSEFVRRRSGSKDHDTEFNEMLGEIMRTIVGIENPEALTFLHSTRKQKISDGMQGIETTCKGMTKVAQLLPDSEIKTNTLQTIKEFEAAAKQRIAIRISDQPAFTIANNQYMKIKDRFETLQDDLLGVDNAAINTSAVAKLSQRPNRVLLETIAGTIDKGKRLVDDLARIRDNRKETVARYTELTNHVDERAHSATTSAKSI